MPQRHVFLCAASGQRLALVTALARITLLRVISPETRERLRPVSTVPDSTPVSGDLVAKFFRGLGDPTLLRILELLRDEGDLSAGALAALLGVTHAEVSNHLSCLRWCGFVAARRSGGEVTSRIADHRVLRLLELARSMLADNAEHVATCCMIEGPTAPLVRPGC